MKRCWPLYLLSLAIAVAACAGRGLTPVASSSAPNWSFAEYRSKHRPHFGSGTASFVLHVPLKKTSHGIKPRFVSIYTKSVAVSVDGGKPNIVEIGLGSKSCYFSPHVFELVCTINVSPGGGSHVFSVKTYDGADATGNLLSANTDVPFTVKPGTKQVIVMTLGGIAKSIAAVGDPPSVSATNSTETGNLLGTEFNVYENELFGMSIIGLDADGYLILGAGAPSTSITVSSSPHFTIVSTPSPQFQNIWLFQTSTSPSNPLTTSTVTISAKETPVPNSGGTTVTGTIKLTLYNHWVYVTNYASSTVGIFDGTNVAQSPTYSQPFSHVPNPTGIAYDSNNHWPYIPDYLDNKICVYTVEGMLITPTGTFPNLSLPADIAYVNANNKNELYVVNNQGSSGGMPVTVYDENGNLVTTANSWAGLGNPRGIAYDPDNQMLYIADNAAKTVLEYDLTGKKIASFSSSLPHTKYGGITFDAQTGTLYAVDAGNAAVVEFTQTGQLIAPGTNPPFPGLTGPTGIADDPYSGIIYVGDGGDNLVHEFFPDGFSLATFPGGGETPYGFAFAP